MSIGLRPAQAEIQERLYYDHSGPQRPKVANPNSLQLFSLASANKLSLKNSLPLMLALLLAQTGQYFGVPVLRIEVQLLQPITPSLNDGTYFLGDQRLDE
ncbi:hypothetical protein A2480_02095 [Candidatus Uhrbacteria bacterium RIFOXYC2_FULL_47_19]|uniref:Uncharacterized protein n=1 Tax=Candidatus Uhrbacteria bacterium RIFOXYC2_FULL_47_19 TaxID=1802424 RepID=A0A1F7WEU2_9BACT|nr:MAG: hypothetical protein A2480_02095 [Candidatus Uhrbacteria bacterium RIFOXYC2_FULL_47_19]